MILRGRSSPSHLEGPYEIGGRGWIETPILSLAGFRRTKLLTNIMVPSGSSSILPIESYRQGYMFVVN